MTLAYGRRHWVSLDGLRGVAVVVVMIYHLGIPHVFPGGYVGVDVFFVLSGFLITSLLIGEHDAHQRVDLKAFYIRRALRLLPALLAVLVVFSIVVEFDPGASSLRHQSLVSVPFVFFYISNWWHIQHSLGVFDHTWSLAIEEQFYIVFPAFFIFIVRTRISKINAARTLAILAAVEVLARSALLGTGISVSTIVDTSVAHSDGLLIGAALAFWLASPERPRLTSKLITRALPTGGAVVLLALILAVPITSALPYDAATSLAPIATVAILMSQVSSPSRWLSFVLSSKIAAWIGKRSYGLYLWHYPIFQLVILTKNPPQHRALPDILVIAASFALAIASYEAIEKPALRLKARFQATEAMPITYASDQNLK